MGFRVKKKIFNNFEKWIEKLANSVLLGELPIIKFIYKYFTFYVECMQSLEKNRETVV